eukprot:COSAG01_NODE_2348_length_7857_cov_4.460299_3_plen_83_part_00
MSHGDVLNATTARVVAIDCTFKDGASLIGKPPHGGSYTCEDPPPEPWLSCQAHSQCAAADLLYGFACQCDSGFTPQNATVCA